MNHLSSFLAWLVSSLNLFDFERIVRICNRAGHCAWHVWRYRTIVDIVTVVGIIVQCCVWCRIEWGKQGSRSNSAVIICNRCAACWHRWCWSCCIWIVTMLVFCCICWCWITCGYVVILIVLVDMRIELAVDSGSGCCRRSCTTVRVGCVCIVVWQLWLALISIQRWKCCRFIVRIGRISKWTACR